MTREGLINTLEDEFRKLVSPCTKETPKVEVKFADKKDLVWKDNKWSIPYIEECIYGEDDNGELYCVSYLRTWKSLRQAKLWLKRNKGTIYSTFTLQLARPIRFVEIKGVVSNE